MAAERKRIVVYRITGRTALLCHSTRGMAMPSSKMKQKEIPSPEEEAKLGLYLLENGEPAFPSLAVRNAMIKSASSRRMKFGKVQAAGVVAAAFMPCEELIPLLNPKSGKVAAWTIDTRPVVVQRARVMRSRPRFESWRIDVPFTIDMTFADNLPDAGLDLLKAAGNFIGLGDYRVERRGMFGQFDAEIHGM